MSGDGLIARVPSAKVAMSTASTYPESTASAFEIAARLGYDGVEVMVWTDPVSQDIDALRRLSDYHQIPILAIHSPCLIITQRVWGTDPWGKLKKARSAAETLGASVVVVHPPFRWQRDYAREFIAGIANMANETEVRFAVENMFPLRARGRAVVPYAPDYSPVDQDFSHVTLDLSHTAVSQSDALAMADDAGRSAGARSHRRWQRHAQGRTPGSGTGHAALRRVAGAVGRERLQRPRRRRGEHPPGGITCRPGGRSRRSAGVHQAEPGGTGRAGLDGGHWRACVSRFWEPERSARRCWPGCWAVALRWTTCASPSSTRTGRTASPRATAWPR